MTINLQIKRTCDHCGHTAGFSGDIQPDDLGRILWSFNMVGSTDCMAVDHRLPGKTFCSDECRMAALTEAGLEPYMGPVFA